MKHVIWKCPSQAGKTCLLGLHDSKWCLFLRLVLFAFTADCRELNWSDSLHLANFFYCQSLHIECDKDHAASFCSRSPRCVHIVIQGHTSVNSSRSTQAANFVMHSDCLDSIRQKDDLQNRGPPKPRWELDLTKN